MEESDRDAFRLRIQIHVTQFLFRFGSVYTSNNQNLASFLLPKHSIRLPNSCFFFQIQVTQFLFLLPNPGYPIPVSSSKCCFFNKRVVQMREKTKEIMSKQAVMIAKHAEERESFITKIPLLLGFQILTPMLLSQHIRTTYEARSTIIFKSEQVREAEYEGRKQRLQLLFYLAVLSYWDIDGSLYPMLAEHVGNYLLHQVLMVSATMRPKNSALKFDLDCERNAKPPTIITEEVSQSIKELILKQISKGLSELGMGMNGSGPVIMSREEFEAQRAELKWKRDFKKHGGTGS